MLSGAGSTSGAATATSELNLAAGIYNADEGVVVGLDNPANTYTTDLRLQFGEGRSIVNGQTTILSGATATNDNTGPVTAVVDSDLIGGIVDQRTLDGAANNSLIDFDGAGTVDAGAFASNTALAQSTGQLGSAGTAIAQIDNDQVVGLAMDVNADESLSLGISATSLQNATAISGNFDDGSDPIAIVAREDEILGTTNSVINALGELQGISSSAELNGTATAISDQGGARTYAEAGAGSSVIGFDNTDLTVAGGLQRGGVAEDFTVNATSRLEATATSENDNVQAYVGALSPDVTGLGTIPTPGGGAPLPGPIPVPGPGTQFATDPAFVGGIIDSDIAISNGSASQGSLVVNVLGEADAEATTTNGTADAVSAMVLRGVQDSDIALQGGVGGGAAAEGLLVDADLSGSAVAEGANGPVSSLGLSAGGIGLDGNDITIARDGSVEAVTSLTGTSSATSTDGSGATAVSGLNGFGILADGGDITLGDNGNITGRSLLQGYSTSADGDAGAVAQTLTNSSGMAGVTGRETFTAGNTTGSIFGEGVTTGSTTATALTGPAQASDFGDTVGVAGLNLVGGQLQGVNQITGTAIVNTSTTATTSTGPVNALAQQTATGLRGTGTGNALSVRGNVLAQALMNVSSTATSVSGVATAQVFGSAIGMENYNVNTIGPSTITVNAGGIFQSQAIGATPTP